MINFHTDKDRKLLTINISDVITIEESIAAAKKFWSEVAAIGKESVIICDIRNLKSGSKSSRVLLQKLMRLLVSYNPKAVIRVVGFFHGAMIFDRAYLNSGETYSVFRVNSLEEAMALAETFTVVPPSSCNLPSLN